MRCYSQVEDSDCVRSVEIYLECDARASICAVAKRVSALAGGDVFGQAGGDAESAGHSGIHVGVALGAVELSGLDGAHGARGAQTRLNKAGRRTRRRARGT